jgi:hypothetical protein
MTMLHSVWCGENKEREDGPRIGSFKIFFDYDGALHFDFVTRFTIDSEIQKIIREMIKEIKDENLWIEKFFEQLEKKDETTTK